MSVHTYWIVDIDATAEEAPALADKVRQWLVEREIILPGPPLMDEAYAPLYRYGPAAARWAHEDALGHDLLCAGLQIVTERTVFHAGEGDVGPFVCPHCGATHDDLPWSPPTEAWYEGEGDNRLTCPACGTASSIAEWRSGWAYGHLGFGFVEGRMLDKLGDELAALTGHRLRVVHEHL